MAKRKIARPRKIQRQKRIAGIKRERSIVLVHPNVKADLFTLAKQERMSVSMMLATLIIEHWHFSEE